MKQFLLPLVLAVLCGVSCAPLAKQNAEKTPAVAEQTDGSQFLGPDVLWRPREQIVFYLMNESGKAFDLTFTLRDLNTYIHAPATGYFFVLGPDDRILAEERVKDDGITGGNPKYQDGLYDPFPDYKYRQYHYYNSPNRYPADKQRNPYLSRPQDLPARTVKIRVPASGRGLYRVHYTGTWDHFVSIDASPKMPCAVHSGTGPLALVGKRKSFCFWYPAESEKLCAALTEEVPPYRCVMTLTDTLTGKSETVKAEGFCTFLIPKEPKKDRVYEIRFRETVPGMCLTLRGVPALFCPDAKTAELFQGGLRFDDRGFGTFFEFGRTLRNWAYSLTPEELKNRVRPLSAKQRETEITPEVTMGMVEDLLNDQLLPAAHHNPAFSARMIGSYKASISDNFHKKAAVGRKQYSCRPNAALAAAYLTPGNPWYKDPVLLRRIYLNESFMISTMTPAMRMVEYTPNELLYNVSPVPKTFWEINTRSNWYGLGLDGGRGARVLKGLEEGMQKGIIPEKVIRAIHQAHRIWAHEHFYMHAAEVANQWGYCINSMKDIADYIGDRDIQDEMMRQQDYLMTPGIMGRLNPDVTTFDKRIGHPDSDQGVTAAGFLPEQRGFDSEYGNQQEWLWGEMYLRYSNPKTLSWLTRITALKTHLIMPRYGRQPKHVFTEGAFPTDFNTRTRGMAHKIGVPKELLGKIRYLDNWFPPKNGKVKEPVPAMLEQDFIRDFGKKFYFIRCGKLYTILYAGPREVVWGNWSSPIVKGNSVTFQGLSGMGYGGWGLACKPGAISGIYVQCSGAAWMSENNSVPDTNTVWGHTLKANYASVGANVDATEVAACYAQPEFKIDEKEKCTELIEPIPCTPLTVTTDLKFTPGRIRVSVRIRSAEAFEMKDLFYSIPYIGDGKTVFRLLNGKETVIRRRKPLVSSHQFKGVSKEQEKARFSPESFAADAFREVFTGKGTFTGTGLELRFDKAYRFRMLQEMQYRSGIPSVGCFVMVLPHRFRAGETHEFSYTVSALIK